MERTEFDALPFKEMVTVVAGDALCDFVKGTPWNTVIGTVARSILQWKEANTTSKKKKVDILKFQPQISKNGLEPDLETIVENYYGRWLDPAMAASVAKQYIEIIRTEAVN